MCKTVSFLSGKGGSGKTTLALSMASMLSRFGIKVLLIDCDLSTNGATYFYEEKLSSKKNQITSFYDLLFKPFGEQLHCIKINDNYDFMPSLTQITDVSTRVYSYEQDNRFYPNEILFSKYDIVLFDCQAGYTDILRLILPTIDVNLVVMEPDAISSAAMRSLFLKIGDIINDKKVYQVFNKASKEEYEVYSKVSGGTVFTNIETIMFDWKIRKAFAVSQIPDLENTSANYGEQIYNVCKIIFQSESIQSKLQEFENVLRLHSIQEKEAELKNTIEELNMNMEGRKNNITKNYIHVILSLSVIILSFISLMSDEFGSKSRQLFLLLITLVTIIAAVFIAFFYLRESNKDRQKQISKLNMYMDELSEIISEKKNLTKKINSTKQNRCD